MTTWEEIQSWLRQQFQLTREELDWCGWAIRLAGVDQVMVAKVTETRPLQIIIAGRVGDRQLIDPVEALRYNSVADAGALVLEGQTYLLRQILPLSQATLTHVAQVIEAIAVEATRLRVLQQAGNRTSAGVCLSYMAD